MYYLSTKVGRNRFKWAIVLVCFLSLCGLVGYNQLSYEHESKGTVHEAVKEVASQNAGVNCAKMNETMETKLNESALKESQEHKSSCNASDREFEMLACLIFAEAGGQPYYDQVCVAEVVINRVNDPRYPNSISAVITQDGQFVPAKSDGTIVNGSGRALSIQDIPESCVSAAQEALNGSRHLSDDTLEFRGSNGEMYFF